MQYPNLFDHGYEYVPYKGLESLVNVLLIPVTADGSIYASHKSVDCWLQTGRERMEQNTCYFNEILSSALCNN